MVEKEMTAVEGALDDQIDGELADEVGLAERADPEPTVEAALDGGEIAGASAAEERVAQLKLDPERVHRFVVGFLLAAAFFFVEAGVAEIALARNASCLESLAQFRLSPDPNEYCMTEFGQQLATSVSRAAFEGDGPQYLIWGMLAVGYGLLGGAFGQLKLREAIAGYLVLHILLLAGLTLIGYLSQFIV